MSGASQAPRPRVGVSLCLLGEEVRHDGGHKRNRYVNDVLGNYFEWVSVCPEVEVGMGTPREPVNLRRRGSAVHMIGLRSGEDWTARMTELSLRRAVDLADTIDGYITKKNSPTCGMERVKIYSEKGVPTREGVGLFITALRERLPNLPIEEEGRLNDAPLRENFITRVYTYARWRGLRAAEPTAAKLIDFHTRHKLLLLAHDPTRYYAMGRLVAEAGVREMGELLEEYEQGLMLALGRPAPARRQVNTLHHLCGFVKDGMDAADKQELLGVIEEYRSGIVPLAVPLTLLRHHLRAVAHPWVEQQVYLNPYPRELALRSHI